jgi:hypothetical protein
MLRMTYNLLAVFLLFHLFCPWDSSADVINRSVYPVYAKPEHGNILIKINPGETFKGEHDGIILPAQSPGKVYKTVDHVDVMVDAVGTIHCHAHDLKGAIGQFLIGGWLDAQSYNSLREWRKSFEKSYELAGSEGKADPKRWY